MILLLIQCIKVQIVLKTLLMIVVKCFKLKIWMKYNNQI